MPKSQKVKDFKLLWSNDKKRREYFKNRENWTQLSEAGSLKLFKLINTPFIIATLEVYEFYTQNIIEQIIAIRKLNENYLIQQFSLDEKTVLDYMKDNKEV